MFYSSSILCLTLMLLQASWIIDASPSQNINRHVSSDAEINNDNYSTNGDSSISDQVTIDKTTPDLTNTNGSTVVNLLLPKKMTYMVPKSEGDNVHPKKYRENAFPKHYVYEYIADLSETNGDLVKAKFIKKSLTHPLVDSLKSNISNHFNFEKDLNANSINKTKLIETNTHDSIKNNTINDSKRTSDIKHDIVGITNEPQNIEEGTSEHQDIKNFEIRNSLNKTIETNNEENNNLGKTSEINILRDHNRTESIVDTEPNNVTRVNRDTQQQINSGDVIEAKEGNTDSINSIPLVINPYSVVDAETQLINVSEQQNHNNKTNLEGSLITEESTKSSEINSENGSAPENPTEPVQNENINLTDNNKASVSSTEQIDVENISLRASTTSKKDGSLSLDVDKNNETGQSTNQNMGISSENNSEPNDHNSDTSMNSTTLMNEHYVSLNKEAHTPEESTKLRELNSENRSAPENFTLPDQNENINVTNNNKASEYSTEQINVENISLRATTTPEEDGSLSLDVNKNNFAEQSTDQNMGASSKNNSEPSDQNSDTSINSTKLKSENYSSLNKEAHTPEETTIIEEGNSENRIAPRVIVETLPVHVDTINSTDYYRTSDSSTEKMYVKNISPGAMSLDVNNQKMDTSSENKSEPNDPNRESLFNSTNESILNQLNNVTESNSNDNENSRSNIEQSNYDVVPKENQDKLTDLYSLINNYNNTNNNGKPTSNNSIDFPPLILKASNNHNTNYNPPENNTINVNSLDNKDTITQINEEINVHVNQSSDNCEHNSKKDENSGTNCDRYCWPFFVPCFPCCINCCPNDNTPKFRCMPILPCVMPSCDSCKSLRTSNNTGCDFPFNWCMPCKY